MSGPVFTATGVFDADMRGYQHVGVELRDSVAVVWLDRPEQGNAFNVLMKAELFHALESLERDDSVRVIVVTGRGRFFSTGAGLDKGKTVGEVAEQPGLQTIEHRPWAMTTPIIAAMNGAAVGMGLTLPLNWDIRIAAEDAKYGFVFTRRGLVPEYNALWLLPRLVGASMAAELLLTGRIFDGREAARIGLVSRAVPAAQVLDVALEIATDLAANTSPVAVALTKRLLWASVTTPDAAAMNDATLAAFRWAAEQPDAHEGVAAFLDKRAPQWQLPKSHPTPEFHLRGG